MTRHMTGLFLLGILLAAQGAPLAASGRHCPMSRSAQSRVCAVCVIPEHPGHDASVSAGSCCRFEAASPTAQTPGVVPSARRANEAAVTALAALPASTRWDDLFSHTAFTDLAPPRSTDSPISLHNTLRL